MHRWHSRNLQGITTGSSTALRAGFYRVMDAEGNDCCTDHTMILLTLVVFGTDNTISGSPTYFEEHSNHSVALPWHFFNWCSSNGHLFNSMHQIVRYSLLPLWRWVTSTLYFREFKIKYHSCHMAENSLKLCFMQTVGDRGTHLEHHFLNQLCCKWEKAKKNTAWREQCFHGEVINLPQRTTHRNN